jgi:hypothetical protein
MAAAWGGRRRWKNFPRGFKSPPPRARGQHWSEGLPLRDMLSLVACRVGLGGSGKILPRRRRLQLLGCPSRLGS